jgi:hypothetical protein
MRDSRSASVCPEPIERPTAKGTERPVCCCRIRPFLRGRHGRLGRHCWAMWPLTRNKGRVVCLSGDVSVAVCGATDCVADDGSLWLRRLIEGLRRIGHVLWYRGRWRHWRVWDGRERHRLWNLVVLSGGPAAGLTVAMITSVSSVLFMGASPVMA